MRAALLFEGIGGFGLAAQRAGIQPVWHAENDRHATKVLAHHWPHIPNLGDVHDITSPPAADVLIGGFPCQDYSVAGRGAGLAGDRGALWWQFHRIAADCRPTWVVGENVHGLTTRAHRESFATIIGSLVDLGYGVVWRVLDAQWFGVAQRRRRVFIVGHSGGEPRPEVLALAQGVSGDTPPSRETGQDTAPTLAARSRGGGGLGTDTELDGGLIPTLTAKSPAALDDQATGQLIASSFNWQNGAEGGLTLTEERTDALVSSQTPAVAFQLRGRDGAPAAEVDPDGLVGALRAGDGGSSRGRMVATTTVRRLTPLECERLQGFPDGWTAIPGNSDSQRYKQLGNAVAVPVAEWIMRRIVETS